MSERYPYNNQGKCDALLWHGPGHQSKTSCYLHSKHDVHECIYGKYDQLARWQGHEAFTGFFDEPPQDK